MLQSLDHFCSDSHKASLLVCTCNGSFGCQRYRSEVRCHGYCRLLEPQIAFARCVFLYSELVRISRRKLIPPAGEHPEGARPERPTTLR
jgi:hypothetical protein